MRQRYIFSESVIKIIIIISRIFKVDNFFDKINSFFILNLHSYNMLLKGFIIHVSLVRHFVKNYSNYGIFRLQLLCFVNIHYKYKQDHVMSNRMLLVRMTYASERRTRCCLPMKNLRYF